MISLFRRAKPLDGGGERVDIELGRRAPRFRSLDQYEKSHWRRYEFAFGQIAEGASVADLACGTGYGSALLARKASRVVGVDLDASVIAAVERRYRRLPNVTFNAGDLRAIDFEAEFDMVVSFETLEHFDEPDLEDLLGRFARALRPGGRLIFSTPYLQERSREAIELGFHRTFLIDEPKLERWLQAASFEPVAFRYQDYATHAIREERGAADFIIGIAALMHA